MEDVFMIGPDGELYHHGTKGMRWGIRRYQNKDGSLTPAGKKRYKSTEEELKAREKVIKNKERVRAMQAKQEAKKAELDAREKALEPPKATKQKRGLFGKKQKSNQETPNKKKSISEMTDDELRAETARMNAERDYLNAKQNLANATPKQVSKGEKFMKSVMDAAVPKLTSSAADLLNKWVTNKASEVLGLNKKDVESMYDQMAKESKYYQDKNKKEQAQKEIKEREERRREVENQKKQEKSKQDKSSDNSKQAKNDKKVEDDIERRMKDIDEKNARERKAREDAEKAEREKVHEGTVENVGRKKKNDDTTSTKKEPVIIDAEEFTELVSVGKKYGSDDRWSNMSVNDSTVTALVPMGRTYTERLMLTDGRNWLPEGDD